MQRIVEMARERVGGIPIYAMVIHTAALADAKKLQAWVRREFNCCEVTISEFSAAMGYATGPGVLGIALCPEFDIAEQEE